MTQTKGANVLLNYNYDFDLTGNLLELTDSPNDILKSTQEYNYDLLGRITSSHGYGDFDSGVQSYNETYTFDDDNRILEKTFEGGMQYTFNYANNDHAITNIAITGSPHGETSVDFVYDDFGNMTQKTVNAAGGSLITEFIYDETNKLTEILLPNDNKKLEFKYDNGGQRIIKELSDNAGLISKNVYVNGFYELINGAINKHISDGQYIFATKLANNDDNLIYYSQNNIGSTTLLTNKDGDDIGQFLYTPFGEMWVEEASTVNIDHITRFFTNQQYDKESGLYYYNARYYDPYLGSFITPDPAMDGLNHYAYANSNPIRYTDPTGLAWWENQGYDSYDEWLDDKVDEWNEWVDSLPNKQEEYQEAAERHERYEERWGHVPEEWISEGERRYTESLEAAQNNGWDAQNLSIDFSGISELIKGIGTLPPNTLPPNPYRNISINCPNTGGSFGWRIHPITGKIQFHTGNDYSASGGNTYAGISGIVTRSRMGQYGEGNYVQVRGMINGQTFLTNSMHNSQNLVNAGQTVHRYSITAIPGSTGGSTGPHIHHEVFTYQGNTEFVQELRNAGVSCYTRGSRTYFEPNSFYQYLDSNGIEY